MLPRIAQLLAFCAVLGCSPHAQNAPGANTSPRPKDPAALDEARRYALSLINRDRKAAGLQPVELDPIASEAAQRHARDMAKHGFTAHWGSDGSVPEQRYTEAGGTDMVQENVACLFDGVPRDLDPSPRFDPALLEKLQRMFMDEVPPNDGHRRNILNRSSARRHRLSTSAVTPLLAKSASDDGDPRSCRARPAQRDLHSLASCTRRSLGGVGSPLDPLYQSLLRSFTDQRLPHSIAIDTLYFPAGFKTPKPVKVEGRAFSIDIGLGAKPQAGRYEVSIWGKEPGKAELFMVSLRTIVVK